MTTETPPTEAPPEPDPPKKSGLLSYLNRHRPRLSLGAFILTVVIGVYAFSLFGVHYLQRSEGPLPPLDLSEGGGNDTIVQLRLDDFKTTSNRLKVDVLVYPPDTLYDKR